MKKFVLTFFVAIVTPVFASDSIQVDSRCLRTQGSKPIRLEWKQFAEVGTDWTSAYVRYKGSKKVIPLILRSIESVEIGQGRPVESKALWLEFFGGKFSGEYLITSQGANIYGFQYKSYRNGREVSFFQDNEAQLESACQWN